MAEDSQAGEEMANRLPAFNDFNFFLATHEEQHGSEYIKKYVMPAFIVSDEESSSELISLNLSESNRILTNKQNHGYFTAYSKLFERFRNKQKLNIVEIGIGSININVPSTMHHYHAGAKRSFGREYWPGGSLILWNKYFKERANVVGWDFDISQARCPGIKVFETDSLVEVKLRETLSSTLKYFKEQGHEGIDIFIDDGLHTPASQQSTFETVFPALNQGGIYIIEDLCIPHFRIDAISRNFISCDISALKILENIMRTSGREAVLYQFAADPPGCIICIQK